MITIPKSIKYDQSLHYRELVTKFEDIGVKHNLLFIIKAVRDLEKAKAVPYLVSRNNKIAVCRKGWIPLTDKTHQSNYYYALINGKGKVVQEGKNSRSPVDIKKALLILASREHTANYVKNLEPLRVPQICDMTGYKTVRSINEPFK